MDRSMSYMGRCIASASLGGEAKALHLGADPIVFCGDEPSGPVSAVEGLVGAWKSYGRSNDEPEATRKVWPDYSGNGNDLTIEMEFTDTAGWHDNAGVFENGYAHGKLKEVLTNPTLFAVIATPSAETMKNSAILVKGDGPQIPNSPIDAINEQLIVMGGTRDPFDDVDLTGPGLFRMPPIMSIRMPDLAVCPVFAMNAMLATGGGNTSKVVIGYDLSGTRYRTYTGSGIVNTFTDDANKEVYIPCQIGEDSYKATIYDIRIYSGQLTAAEADTVVAEMLASYNEHFPQG